ncbi:hypothetical protein [Aminipila terrae]|uniref:Uncharacterized protein n=1 Tax=Aminipila terrae TaxID=2697030 RepID=A0A6P1MLF0_9FIRM|nr:hypothetical protein [Aminipila terrae]QHI73504.1 hypothetical protein Ami3637_14955 [Aminipila terrae]
MTYYDEQLRLLQKQVAQKKRNESKLKELYVQRQKLSTKVDELKNSMLDEKDDVDRLENQSLAAFFYGVIGKLDEKLDKERKEAYAAKLKYDVAARELSAVEKEIQYLETEMKQLLGCEQQYERALKAKADMIKSTDSQEALKIFQKEQNIAYIESQKKEIQEALNVGHTALATTNRILSSLDSAAGWGTWDLLGGGLITDLAKHSQLDEAQNQVGELQAQLRHFKTELADVTINADIQVNIESFLRFADYFFDGMLADYAVLDKINQSQAQVRNTKGQIEGVMNHLNSMLSNTNKELECEKIMLNDLIVDAAM